MSTQNKKIQLLVSLLLQALSWGKDIVAMSGSGPGSCRRSLLHHTCITWFIMSHKWWKSMAVWGSLVEKVFLSIYMSKCMEHGKLNHLLFHDIRYKWIHISQSLGSENSVYSNFLPTIQYKYPFGEFASFHLFWGVETKNDDPRRYFQRKSNRWDAVTNLLVAEKLQKEVLGQEWVKRGYERKGWSEASDKNLNSTTSSS